ncbi:MAG: poly-beta-1,6-N-acetyl-D-glucosamine N-deacetylase PgaB [Syntrophotaleaceae bacterium]
MKTAGIVLGLMLFLLPMAGIADATEPLYAAQVSWLPCKTEAELSQEFQRMREQGFDTLVVRVFHNRGDRFYPFIQPGADAGVYFKTREAPVVADILTPLIPLARAAGLRVYAWANTLSTPLTGSRDLHGRRYELAQGSVTATEKLDPFHPEVRNRLRALFEDLARYDLDGILLQDDLVLRHTEGFSAAGLSAYLNHSGQLPDPKDFYRNLRRDAEGRVRVGAYSAAFRLWARWKGRTLLNLATSLREAVRQINPDLKLVINLPYEVLSNPEGALAWFSLDFAEVRKCDFDYLGLMLYHRQMARELGVSIDEAMRLAGRLAAEGAGLLGRPERLLVKLQAVDFENLQPIVSKERDEVSGKLGRQPFSKAWFPYVRP